MVAKMSDEDIWQLKRGGPRLPQGVRGLPGGDGAHRQPTVILAKTIKGYGLGTHFAGRNATHQMKKLTLEDLKVFRDSLRIPITDAQLRRTRTCRRTTHPARTTRSLAYVPRPAAQARRSRCAAAG
jgi:pyruvate dehydrogenase E1 component